ncbi:DUF4352 domain-containing protein [Candidatus Saccharibacteria bacterium]|nr:DUF4352 domain-containing protein [Candidatus Saccharibacteria bacterium]
MANPKARPQATRKPAVTKVSATTKKPVYKQWWFWLIIVVVLIGVAGSSASNKESSPSGSSSSSSSSSTPNEKKEPRIGDDVTAGKSVIKVISVEYNYADPDGYWTPSDGKEYVKVNVSQHNNSDSKISFNALYWSLQDGNGVAQNYLGAGLSQTDDFFGSGDLASGGTRAGSLVFEIPAGDRNLVLIYDPMEWGVEAEIKL